ncbi:RDD family protein [Rhodococcoides fascians]|uniref:RDD family protein n=1 Tax=Rhodococcoides fascians TaxID=1828 RepID=UPI000A705024|nr:RDD family protein [Rhodococcus fascians]
MSENPPNGPQYGSDPNQPQYPQNPAGGYPPPGNGGGYPPPGSYPPPGNYPPPPGNYPPPPVGGNAAYGSGSQLPGGGQPGSLGLRFGARLIDGIIVGIVLAVFYVILPSGFFGSLLFGIISAVLGFSYFVFLESSRGQTFGKQLLGLRTVGVAGGNPTQAEAAKRNAFMLLNVVPLLGGLLVFIAYIVIAVTINSSPTKQGKHDEIAGGTQVITTK